MNVKEDARMLDIKVPTRRPRHRRLHRAGEDPLAFLLLPAVPGPPYRSGSNRSRHPVEPEVRRYCRYQQKGRLSE